MDVVVFSFGTWISQRRRSLRLTQPEVANLVGCSVVLIRKIESDTRRPSIQIAKRLAQVLHVPPDDIPAFVQAARAELAIDQLPAPTASLAYLMRDGGQLHLPTLTPRTHGNLPQEISSFYGREHEISELRTQLRTRVRLITLTGPGGIGKTRLALEVAQGLDQPYPDGRWFADLSLVHDPQQVAMVIMQACGIREQPGHSRQTQLITWLRTKQLLLIIDNYEHVIAAAPLVSDILRAAPHVQILATSRISLRLTGEHEYQVRALSLSEAESATTPLTHVSAAVQLFANRAQSVQAPFQLTTTTARIAHAICVRLEGLPLAIELAAARMRIFTPAQLLQQLQSAILPLLDHGKRDLPARQQTMRATIAWSYQLLTPAQRQLLARLSVFVGGWTLEAAEAVGAEGGLNVIDELERLVEQSLIQRVSVDGWPRFTMLELIREYAREQLTIAHEGAIMQRRQALHMLDYAAIHVPQLYRTEQFLASRLLLTDQENIRSALEWLFETDPPRAFQLTCTLWEYWNIHGKLVEAVHWLTKALEQSPAAPPLLRAAALDHLGWCIHLQDHNERALTLFQASVALYESQGDTLGATFSTLHMCLAYRKQSRFDLGYQVLDHCLPIFLDYNETYGVAWCLFLRGLLFMDQDQLDTAWDLLHEARTCFQRCHDHYYPEWICHNLGHIARLRGELDLAEQLYMAALTMLRHAGERASEAEGLICLGHLARLRRKPLQAAAIYVEGLRTLYEVGNRRRIADVLDGLGGVLVQVGHANDAARMMGAALSLREVIKIPLAPAEQLGYQCMYTELHAALPEPQRSSAWQAGRAMSLDMAIAEAFQLATRIGSNAVVESYSELYEG